MNDLKIRAWDGKKLEVFEHDKTEPYYNIGLSHFLAKHYDSDIMLFAGMLDKHGIEIYEGDIIKEVYYPIGGRPSIYEYSQIGVVESNGWSFGVRWKLSVGTQIKPNKCLRHERNYRKAHKCPSVGLDWFYRDAFLVGSKRLEVIGNIFEGKYKDLLSLED